MLMEGTIKWYSEEKGFGFITPDDNSGDVFVHRMALTDGATFITRQKVSYQVEWNNQKQEMVAVKVQGAGFELGVGG